MISYPIAAEGNRNDLGKPVRGRSSSALYRRGRALGSPAYAAFSRSTDPATAAGPPTKDASGSMGNVTLGSPPGRNASAISKARRMLPACTATL